MELPLINNPKFNYNVHMRRKSCFIFLKSCFTFKINVIVGGRDYVRIWH